MKQPHQYRPLEQQPQHDACGIGAVVNISGQRTHETLDGALKIVEKLAHRTGKDADGTTGDGVGVMTQLPHALFQKAAQQAYAAYLPLERKICRQAGNGCFPLEEGRSH